jgi:hypothetical protein
MVPRRVQLNDLILPEACPSAIDGAIERQAFEKKHWTLADFRVPIITIDAPPEKG